METPPTTAQFSAYQKAYDWFNDALFDGSLKPCLLNFSRKSRNTMGFFAPKRWSDGVDHTHEISLNPDVLERPIDETFGTLVHEMVHQWQEDFGKPSKSGYHNRQWADKMAEIGLIPSDTGLPGGKQTGSRMTHYIDPDGAFKQAFDAMPQGLRLPWLAGPGMQKQTKRNKVVYQCPECGSKVWGKPDMNVLCGEHEQPVLMVDPELAIAA